MNSLDSHPFMIAVAAYAREHKVSRGDAIEAVAIAQPQLHAKFVQDANTKPR